MNQGCPGEGKDNRTLGWLICPLQRLLSRKSDKQPRLLTTTVGITNETPVIQAAAGLWPPYFVVNIGRPLWWRMFRLGWRYDKNWKGYIGPSAAWKKLTSPLTYY